MSASDVEFFTIEFRKIMGLKFAICGSMSSRCTHYCAAERRAASGVSSLSFTRPLVGVLEDVLPHETSSLMKCAKYVSSERI